jgi:hyperosmotically inducible protein
MYKKPKNLIVTSGLALLLTTLNASYAAESSTQSLTDVRQEVQIWTTYALNPYLRADSLKVSVKDGKATLTGFVPEGVNKDLAKEIALGVEGIKDVDNQIEVVAEPRASESSSMGGFANTIDDATITAAVKSKLLWSRYTEGLKTTVVTKSGRVVLTGTADSEAAKELAGRLAMNTRGVVSVNNSLVVSDAKTAGKDSVKNAVTSASTDVEKSISDSWITTKVKSTLLYSSNVSGSDIEVTTKSGVVSLVGHLSSGAEKALAIELAQNVRGVKRVESKGLTF